MTDASLFTSGALFTQDYLIEGITGTAQYSAVDIAATRARLEAILSGFPFASKPNEATTEKDAIWPIMAALGWDDYLTQQNLSVTGRVDVPDGLLFIDAAAKAKANEYPEEWKRYQFGAAVFEAKRWGRALDRAEGRKGDDKDTPSTQLLRYMRIVDDRHNGAIRWGILTNGIKWRLYYSGARSTIDDYLEIDLSRVMALDGDLLDTGIADSERDHWLAVFAAMFDRTAFERASDTAPSFHDNARRDAAFYEERVAKSLSDKVFGTLYPALGRAVAEAAPADAELDEIRQATLILLYRLLFVLYAEDRGLLPVKDKRFDDYALRVSRLDVGKRKDAGDAFSHVAKTIWNRFADLAEMIDKGDPSVGLPPYNGGLFNGENTPLLKAIRLGDDVMAEALDILSFEQRDGIRRYINYRDLSVQQLGSIYERLLEFELIRDAESGAVDVRPNIFARKNSGSYYTPDDLVLLILDETLQPLIDDAREGFKAALAKAKASDNEEYTIAELQKLDPAKAITRLRVCDPAMGSGHFLVSLVDRLTNHTLDALAEAGAMVAERFPDLDYESPVSEEVRKIRATIRGNARDKNWSVSEEQLDDAQLVKRMVLKRCIYGADKNPMAVELAKVALWLHTFTVGAPLSFIDHHLAAGDSLFGLWVRDAIDKAGKGGELLYIEDLRNAERQASVMQRIEALTDAEIAEAHDSAKMWQDVEYQVGPFNSFVSFIHALDWLNLKGEINRAAVRELLSGQYGDPLAIMRGKIQPSAKQTTFQASGANDRLKKQKFEASELFDTVQHIVTEARQLITEERFLNWQITFPGVWTNWGSAGLEGGFDAIVGNPPWEEITLDRVKWFAARKPEIANTNRAADREKMVENLVDKDVSLANDFHHALSRSLQTAHVARNGGAYPALGKGELNLYKLFVERALQLVRKGGMIGLLVPIGIGTDKSSAKFFSDVVETGRLRAFLAFENKKRWLFRDVHSEDQPTVLVLRSSDTRLDRFKYAVKLHEMPNLATMDGAIWLTASTLRQVNPITGTAPIFRSKRDMKLMVLMYERHPTLGGADGMPNGVWPVSYLRMIDMTLASEDFRESEELEEQGAWSIPNGRFDSPSGIWMPLFEGKMLSIYNHRYASVRQPLDRSSGQGVSVHTEIGELKNPSFRPFPRYWINDAHIRHGFDYAIGFNDICNTNNSRSLLSAIVPYGAYGNKLPILHSKSGAMTASDFSLIQGNLGSIICDYAARQKIQSRNLNKYIVEQLPVITPAAYARVFGTKSAADIVKAAVLELTYTAHDMAPFARDLGHVDAKGEVLPPFIWDEERRLHLRAKLDALYFILYGVFDPADTTQSRDDIRYIYSTFPIVERQEIAAYGSYRSRDLCLAYINTLMAGQPDAEVVG